MPWAHPRARASVPRALFAAAVSGLLSWAVPVHGAAAADPLDEAARLQSIQRWAAAESLAIDALASAERRTPPDPATMSRALELLARGRVARRISSDTSGIAWAGRLLALRDAERPRDTLAIADAAGLLGRLHGMAERFPTGLEHLGRALALQRALRSDEDTLVAETRLAIGTLQRRARDLPAAERTLGEAIASYRRRARPGNSLLGSLEVELAGTLTWMNRFDEARAAYLRAIECWEPRFGPHGGPLGTVYDGLSQLEKNSGDMARSLDWLERAVDVKTRAYGPTARPTLISRANLGSRLIEFGDHGGARRQLEPLVTPIEAIFGRGHSVTEQVRTQLGIACLAGGDTAAAARHLQASLAALEARPGDHRAELVWTLKWLAETRSRSGDLGAALALNRRALENGRGLEVGETYMLIQLRAQELDLLARSDRSAEMPAAIRALDTLVAVGQLAGTQAEAEALIAQTRAYASAGERGRAWETALAGETMHRRLVQASASGLSDRQALGLSQQWSEALPNLARLALGGVPADPALAWDRTQRWRGWWSRERELRRAPTADTAAAAAHARWVAAQRRYARLVVERATGAERAGDTIERARAESERAEAQYRTALRLAGGLDPGGERSLAEVLSRLAPDEALVSFVTAAATPESAPLLAAYVARTGGVTILDLGEESAARQALGDWRRLLAAPPGKRAPAAERACRAAGGQVRKRLWDPLASRLGDARTVYIVDGPLGDVPWLALPVGTREYLAERGPALRVLEAESDLLRVPGAGGADRMLALGAPDFDRRSPRASEDTLLAAGVLRGADACTPLPRLSTLPGARAEVQEAAATLAAAGMAGDPLVLTGPEADEARFKREAPGRTLLHLATHGVVLADTCGTGVQGLRGVGGLEVYVAPRRSRKTGARTPATSARPDTVHTPSPWLGRRVWLAFAGVHNALEARGDEDEGMLTAEEVVTLDLRAADWVVLSACHSGAVEGWTEEGALGMTRAFRLAGARTVIASRWSLEDAAAREWMRALYLARAGGTRQGSDALAAACRRTLAARRSSGRTTHPFYWAAFSAWGD